MRKSYPSAEMQSVYSTAPTDWAEQSGLYSLGMVKSMLTDTSQASLRFFSNAAKSLQFGCVTFTHPLYSADIILRIVIYSDLYEIFI